MKYALIPIGALAAALIAALYFAVQPAPKPATVTRRINVPQSVKKLSNAEFVNELGAPSAAINCKALFGQAGLVGGFWADARNQRYVIVCAPGSAQ